MTTAISQEGKLISKVRIHDHFTKMLCGIWLLSLDTTGNKQTSHTTQQISSRFFNIKH